MRRLTATFVAVCMVLMASSLGAVLFLAAGLPVIHSAIVALAALICLVLYNAVSTRLRDRMDLGDQIGDLSRGTSDLARQVAELGRRLTAMEERVDSTVNRARGAVDPIAAEMGELGALVKQLADTVALHDTRLRGHALTGPAPARSAAASLAMPNPAAHPVAHPAAYEPMPQPVMLGDPSPLLLTTDDIAPADAAPEPVAVAMPAATPATGRFKGMSREAIVATIAGAIDSHRVDLYLQPIVTLPQRKVRYYEAMSRLRTQDGDVVPADEFIDHAEAGGIMPKIDNLLLFRCVQVVRRLLLKNRDVGLFCNISMSTLTDPGYFRQLHDFMQANRALAPSLVFEFRQNAYRSFGAIEHEGLAALADLGFRFSLDHVTDLRIEPKELFDRGFRFLKTPAKLLLNKAAAGQSDIDAADLSNLLARFSIELIAERIESENMVVDLLDYDVKFGQGFLFSPPRPVRPEALHGQTPSGDPLVAPGSPPPSAPPQSAPQSAPRAMPQASALDAKAPGAASAQKPAADDSAAVLAAPDFVPQNLPA
jgi:cyclic-di-GMP phosphodiesterase TipF (flagellum assembly factor)